MFVWPKLDFDTLVLQGNNKAAESVSRAREDWDEAATAPCSLTKMSLKMIAELVCKFDGIPDHFNVWEKQVKIKISHELNDDEAKILIVKLKKKTFKWLHSKAEHLEVSFNKLIAEIW